MWEAMQLTNPCVAELSTARHAVMSKTQKIETLPITLEGNYINC